MDRNAAKNVCDTVDIAFQSLPEQLDLEKRRRGPAAQCFCDGNQSSAIVSQPPLQNWIWVGEKEDGTTSNNANRSARL
jgi:hypothetical protein